MPEPLKLNDEMTSVISSYPGQSRFDRLPPGIASGTPKIPALTDVPVWPLAETVVETCSTEALAKQLLPFWQSVFES
jgi:hypothetical protein